MGLCKIEQWSCSWARARRETEKWVRVLGSNNEYATKQYFGSLYIYVYIKKSMKITFEFKKDTWRSFKNRSESEGCSVGMFRAAVSTCYLVSYTSSCYNQLANDCQFEGFKVSTSLLGIINTSQFIPTPSRQNNSWKMCGRKEWFPFSLTFAHNKNI